MKTKGIILAVILLSALIVVIFGIKKKEPPRREAAVIGLAAPELIVTDPSGKNYNMSELKGSVLFINFWATWCPPCREEMPSIQDLYRRFRDEKGFRMITILYREDYQKAIAYMKENNYEFLVLMDRSEETAKSYGVTGVPETYIIDKKGILREKTIGPADWSSPQAISLISNLIQE